MANNTTLNAGSGGDTIRDLDRSGVKTPIVAIDLNPAGSEALMAGAMPITAASLPLPTGAAADTSVNGILLAQGSSTSGQKGPLVQAAVQGAPPSYTNGNTEPFSMDTAGNIRVLATQTGTYAVTQSGTWNVGTVTTVSAVTSITNALPAGTNLLGQVSASNETATVYNGTTALTPQFATIVASSSGATTIVAATGGKKIRVLRWSLSANGGVNVKWQSHVTPTDLTGLHYMTQYSTAGGAYCPVGIFQTLTGEALDINLSGAVAVGGELTYVLV